MPEGRIHEVPLSVDALASGGVMTWGILEDLARKMPHFTGQALIEWIIVENESPNTITIVDTQQVVAAGATWQEFFPNGAIRFQLKAGGAIGATEYRVRIGIRGCC